MTQPTTGPTSTGPTGATSLSSSAAAQAGQADARSDAVDVAETPWQEDGEDYGRDLGTGVPASVGDPEHLVDTPRSYESDAAEETVVAPTSKPSDGVVKLPTGQNAPEKAPTPPGTSPVAPTGGNG